MVQNMYYIGTKYHKMNLTFCLRHKSSSQFHPLEAFPSDNSHTPELSVSLVPTSIDRLKLA